MLDALFLRLRSSAFLYRFALFTRVLLAAGFLPTGLVKVLGERFTQIAPDSPIGAFFEAMFQTGLYWRFLGFSQMLAGALLLLPRWAHLGAAAFLPIMVNIFVITVALGFRGTPVVTGLMLLAVLFLCAWDYHRFRPLLRQGPPLEGIVEHRLAPFERFGFSVFAASFLAAFASTRGFVPLSWVGPAMVLGGLAGLTTAGYFFITRWRRRSAVRA
ncbi:MAG: DoxX family protein [Acidobacteriota bacterium]